MSAPGGDAAQRGARWNLSAAALRFP